MSRSEIEEILAKLEQLERKVDRTWRAIAGDTVAHSKGLGQRVDENEGDIRSLKKDRTKAGAIIGAILMILGAFGAKIIELFRQH